MTSDELRKDSVSQRLVMGLFANYLHIENGTGQSHVAFTLVLQRVPSLPVLLREHAQCDELKLRSLLLCKNVCLIVMTRRATLKT